MPQFTVDHDIAVLVEKLAKKKPFETLSFNDALRRIFAVDKAQLKNNLTLKDLGLSPHETTSTMAKRAASPSVKDWINQVPELRNKQGLNSWKAVCDALDIETAGDSARRKLKNWVSARRPTWPTVPDA